jgi:polyferredoxin
MFCFFEAVAVTLWLTLGTIFYLFNFSYIGACLSLGTALYISKVKFARMAVQLAVGLYMLVHLGLISSENMMIEGFWYYLFLGVFEAAVIHYAVAKIFGPLLFGRGWCGYACWTAMILELLPYKAPQSPRKNIGAIRYALFAVSFLFVGALFVFKIPGSEKIMLWSFVIGNILYYGVGVSLAFLLKDNRAFCKYICPITVFLKPASYFSLLRIKNNKETCVTCGKCKKVCPMDVDMTDNSRKRINGTECILCFQCVESCPKKSLYI